MPDDSPVPDPAATRRRRWGARLAGALSLGVLAASGAGWSVLNGVGDSLGRVDAFAGAHDRPAASDGSAPTFLLVGTDDREGIPRRRLKEVLHAGGESCHCTDTMMLVHLSRDRSRATVVSIPRDSYVTIPAHTDPATGRPVSAGRGKINAAYGMGGAPLTVQTVEQATGLRVDHYLEVDFRTFVSTVDALGGVEVCSAVPLHDTYAGLDLPAGATRLDGAGALKYVRARHVDASSDLGRMQRQQRLVAQVLHEAASEGTLLNPARLGRVMGTALASVKADRGLSTRDLLDLASSLRGFSTDDAAFTTVPVADVNHVVPGWGSTVLWDAPAARALFDALRHDRPLPAAPGTGAPAPGAGGTGPGAPSAGSTGGAAAHRTAAPAPGGRALTVPPLQVRVQVLNGTRTPGLGARVDRELRQAGFATTGLASNAAGGGAARTVVRYDPRWDESVRTLAAALPRARLVPVPGLGAVLQVVVGSDHTAPRRVTVAPHPAAVSSATTTATRAACP
ncbi:LCP family protein [Streptomyces sp. NPDC001380]|uniref:LCP family protein n=1 Tax=Streptomyces sp. NPDC001380 TaxID=3364566 RepID=UPI0036BFAEF5